MAREKVDNDYTHVSQMPAETLFQHVFPDLLKKYKNRGEMMIVDILMECWKYEERGKGVPLVFKVIDYFKERRQTKGYEAALRKLDYRLNYSGNRIIGTFADICREKEGDEAWAIFRYFMGKMFHYVYLDESELDEKEKIKFAHFKETGQLLPGVTIAKKKSQKRLVRTLQET